MVGLGTTGGTAGAAGVLRGERAAPGSQRQPRAQRTPPRAGAARGQWAGAPAGRPGPRHGPAAQGRGVLGGGAPLACRPACV